MYRLRQLNASQRALWVLLLLLAVVLKPALVMASAMHESEHAARTGHAHDSLQDAHQIPNDETGVGDIDPWHSLMHLGHCCSHPSAAPGGDLLITQVTANIAPEIPLMRRRANAGLKQPLRPPIRA